MLAFLRKFRNAVMDSPSEASVKEGRPLQKYLFYALGEIALVVIGILIALQFNNWNEERQEKEELNTYLQHINNNLKSDLISLAEIRSFRDSSIQNSKNYLLLAKRENITPEEFLQACFP